MKNFWNRES